MPKLHFLSLFQDKSFSNVSGGGGPQSNLNTVPYLMHMALYVLNTTRGVQREEKNLASFLEAPTWKWLSSAYQADGPLYYTTLALLICPPKKWQEIRVKLLQRLLVAAHVRAVS